MSDASVKQIKVRLNPRLLRRELPVVKLNAPVFREDVLYNDKGEYFRGEGHVRIVNKQNRFTETNRTIAFCEIDGKVVEKTSDNITQLIGQNNYDLLISALCSVLSQELRIRGIHALLTQPKCSKDSATQADSIANDKRCYDASSQTEVLVLSKKPLRKPVRRKLRTPYVVEDTKADIKKVVIDPEVFIEKFNIPERRASFDHVTECLGENSNDSISTFSVASTETLLHNPYVLLKNIDKHIKSPAEAVSTDLSQEPSEFTVMPPNAHSIGRQDCNSIKYHEYFSPIEQRKMLLKIALEEWKISDIHDEDGNLPLHVAVIEKNLQRVKRMCHALNSKKMSLDTPGAGGWTALKLSVNQDSPSVTEMLLRCGADPLLQDEEDRNSLHHAAESLSGHLNVIVSYCVQNARSILEQNEDLWKPHYEKMADVELSRILLESVCTACDDQGYTPLMLASKLGRKDNVQLLIHAAPSALNKRMPTSGNTALYLAVDAAYYAAFSRGNTSKLSDDYRQTLECLLENGANPSIENYSSVDVNNLLTELNVAELSMLVANKLTLRRFDNPSVMEKNFDEYMLVKEEESIHITDINEGKSTKRQRNVRSKQVIKPYNVGKLTDQGGTLNSRITVKDAKTKPSIEPSVKENIIDYGNYSNKLIIVDKEGIHINKELVKTSGNVGINTVINDDIDTTNGGVLENNVSVKKEDIQVNKDKLIKRPRNVKVKTLILEKNAIAVRKRHSNLSNEYVLIKEEEKTDVNKGELIKRSKNVKIPRIIVPNDVQSKIVGNGSNKNVIAKEDKRIDRTEKESGKTNQPNSDKIQQMTVQKNVRKYISDMSTAVPMSPIGKNVVVVKGNQAGDIKIEVCKATHKRKLEMTNVSSPSKVKPN